MASRIAPDASIYDRFAAVVDEQGLNIALITAKQTVTYEALRTAVDNFAAVLAGKGLKSGQMIGIDFSHPEFYVIALLAANRLGAGVVQTEAIDSQLLNPRPSLILSDSDVPVQQRAGATLIDATWFTKKDIGRLPGRRSARDSLICMFGTSGSTGKRKYLQISETNILTRLPFKRHMIEEETRLLATMGARTAVATELHLTALLSGASVMLLPPEPQNLPYYIDLFGATSLVSTPLLISDLITLDLPREIFRSLDRVVMAGAAAAPEVVERAASRICPNVILSYGSTETGTTANFYYAQDKAHYVPGVVGKLNPGVDLELVDETGAPVAEGDEGSIRIKREGFLVENAYANPLEDETDRFVDEWFYPGDRGRFDGVGNLIICGRDDNVINAGGNKYAIELIESVLEEKLGNPCIVLAGEATQNTAQIILVLQGESPSHFQFGADVLRGRFKRVGLERVYEVAALPMTDTGKKDRVSMARDIEEEAESLRCVFSADASQQQG